MNDAFGRHHVAAVWNGQIRATGQQPVIASVKDVTTDDLDSYRLTQPTFRIAIEVDEGDPTSEPKIFLSRQYIVQDEVGNAIAD